MINLEVLPNRIIEDLKSRGHSEEDISYMQPEKVFTEFCSWHGFAGWGSTLWDAVHEIKESEEG